MWKKPVSSREKVHFLKPVFLKTILDKTNTLLNLHYTAQINFWICEYCYLSYSFQKLTMKSDFAFSNIEYPKPYLLPFDTEISAIILVKNGL